MLRLFVEETIPPKVKYLVIVGSTSDKIATVYINSDLFLNDIPVGSQAYQLPITPAELSCLIRNSLIDCSDIVERDKASINKILQIEPGRKEGALAQAKIAEVLRLVKTSKTISNSEKNKFGLL